MPGAAPREGRLNARPSAAGASRVRHAGRSALGLGAERDGLVHVPAQAAAGVPSPLVVLLHGAGSSAGPAIDVLAPFADARGLVLLAPDSRASTWDGVRGRLGPDVGFIDRALAHVFRTCPIDTARVALGGFSDGASYALSLGLANGDLFDTVLAFAPGFSAPPGVAGRPRTWIAHGRADRVLPVERCGRRVARELRGAGFAVTYEEFDGGHVVRPDLVTRALDWWLAGS